MLPVVKWLQLWHQPGLPLYSSVGAINSCNLGRVTSPSSTLFVVKQGFKFFLGHMVIMGTA